MARIEDEPALILHTRPYRESSVLVDLLTAHHGRVASLLKGGRSRVQVFSTFHATWYGGRELVTLANPANLQVQWLQGDAASAGLYINELIIRLVREREPVPELFAVACWALSEFDRGADLRPALRSFEKQLLETLGYALNYAAELDSGATITQDNWYRLVDAQGFVLDSQATARKADGSHSQANAAAGFVERGEQLLLSGRMIAAIAAEEFAVSAVNAAARRLFRRALQPLLGDKPLKSRELLNHMAERAS